MELFTSLDMEIDLVLIHCHLNYRLVILYQSCDHVTPVRIKDTQKLISHTQRTQYLRGSAQCLHPRTEMRIITKMEQKYKYRGGDKTHSTHSSHTQFLISLGSHSLSVHFNSPLNLYLYTNEGEPHWSPPTFFHSLMGLVEWESHFHWVEKVGSPIGAHMG
ncbi:hypothetical protein CsSME_00030281 [Camellia sinensis var. sinensis]